MNKKLRPNNISILLLIFAISCNKQSKNNIFKIYEDFEDNSAFNQLEKYVNNACETKKIIGENIHLPDSTLNLLRNKSNLASFVDNINQHWVTDSLFKWFEIVEKHGLPNSNYHFKLLQTINLRFKSKTWKEETTLPKDSFFAFYILAYDGLIESYSNITLGRTKPEMISNAWYNHKSETSAMGFWKVNNGLELIKNHIPKFKSYTSIQKEYARILQLNKAELAYQLPREGNFPNNSKWIQNVLYKMRAAGVDGITDSLIKVTKKSTAYYVQKVSAFQDKYELEKEEKLSKKAIAILNRNYTIIGQKLMLALDRWRWIGHEPEKNHIWINVAQNNLKAFRNDSLVLAMNVCTGEARNEYWYKRLELSKKDTAVHAPDNHETPVIFSNITHFTVNPSWWVPQNIFIKEMMGIIKRNPGYLIKAGYEIRNWSNKVVDPYSINWEKINPKKMGIRLVQKGGKGNALGKLIVHFDNNLSIYCHDTPLKGYFSASNRNVSHGCIRLEYPFKLMEYIGSLNEETVDTDKVYIAAGMAPKRDTALIRKYREDLKDTSKIKKFQPKTDFRVNVKNKIPIYIVYNTCEINKNGVLELYPDVYKRDELMLKQF